MKIVGIIAEYNPFHKGHEFHIEKAKKITGADAAIIITVSYTHLTLPTKRIV